MPIKTKRTEKRPSQFDALVKPAQKLSGLKKKTGAPNPILQNTEPHSFYEMTKSLAGSVRGPSDLVHNEKHMQGFGQ